jgi:type II secretory pathway pseudopilin PulG
MNTWRWLLSNQIKSSCSYQKNRGFTLIELLIAMLIAFLVITPLLGFMMNILNTDRQEQAKANTEQEVQAAMDYINRDLQQAIYIYDGTGVDAIKAQLPTIKDGNPVLVFWKREFVEDADVTKLKNSEFKDDAFVNSLVAYYLISDKAEPWSKASRIARFQIKDGVPNRNGSTCSDAYDTTSTYTVCPDTGFQPVDLSEKDKTLTQKMNSWTKTSKAYTQNTITLVDFIDQTTIDKGAPAAECPKVAKEEDDPEFTPVPSGTTMTGFYACVISISKENRSIAEVYLRGNSLARLTNDENQILYDTDKSPSFPTARVRVQGRSFVFSK